VPTGATHGLVVPPGETTLWSVVAGGDASPLLLPSGQINYKISPLAFPSVGTTGSLTLGFAGLSQTYALSNVFTPSTVTYPLPSIITQTTLLSTALNVGKAVSAQTLTLSGSNTANLAVANIAVYLNTSSEIVSNCTVTGYAAGTGVVTFTATPTVSGMNTLYVRITAPIAGSTQTTTLSYVGTGQGFFVDNRLVTTIAAKSTGAQNIVIASNLSNASVLLVAGGGGGSFSAGGGGGAGGVVYVANATITAGTYSVTVGAGGSGATFDGGQGFAGSNTTAFGLTAYGGGGGAHLHSGYTGGCGGGSGYSGGTGGTVAPTVMSGTSTIGAWVMYGNVGGNGANQGTRYSGAGGGGVGSAGAINSSTSGGNGGDGQSAWSTMGIAAGVGHNIDGVCWFGGGGGGSSDDLNGVQVAGKGGKGGGGNGGVTRAGFAVATNGLANTGGGGGGGCMISVSGVAAYTTPPGGSGGSGVVIVHAEATYTMPSAFTYVKETVTMTITTTGASATPAPLVVYYGATAGITKVASLTQAGTGTLASGTSVVSVSTFPVGMWYVYICVTSPNGATGPLIGAVATLTVIITSGIALLLDAGSASSYPGTGTTWTDIGGRGNTGILTNGPTYDSDNGGSIAFDGTNDYIAGSIQATTFSGAHTISCWFYRRVATSWTGVFSNSVGVGSGSMLTFTANSNVIGTFQLNVNGYLLAASIDLGEDHVNQWIYVTIVYAGAASGSAVTMYAYKNGALLTSCGSLYWSLATTSSYWIGRIDATNLPFNGYIPHVAVYSRALTAAEVDQNYNALKGRYTAMATIAPGARWMKQAPTWVRPGSGIDNPSDLTYSSDGSTLTVASPSCNGPWPWYGTMQFSDFAKHTFTGDFTLILKCTNAIFGMFNVFSSPTLSLGVLSMMPNKNAGWTACSPIQAWRPGMIMPGFANYGSDCGLMLAGYSDPLAPYSLGCVFLSSPTTQQLTGRIGFGNTRPGTVYIRFMRSGNTLTPSTSSDGTSWSLTPSSSVLAVMGMDQMNAVTVPTNHKVMIGFSPYDVTNGTGVPLRSITLSCPFQFPTGATFTPTSVTANIATSLTFIMTGHDTTMNSTCTVSTIVNNSTTRVGIGTLATTGTAVVSCTFTTPGTYNLVFSITSGAGLTSANVMCSTSVLVTAAAHPPFKLPQNHGGAYGIINSDGSWTTAASYCGVILDQVFTGDFTFVLSYYFAGNPEYMKASDHVMVVHPSANTDNFFNITAEWWQSAGSNFPGYTLAMNHYNYTYGGGQLFTVWGPFTYWQYQRLGNTLTLRNSQNPTGPWNNVKQATVTSDVKVICGVGMIYSGVHEVKVVSIDLTTPVRYIRLTNITTTDSLLCGKVGLYASSADAEADTGNATTNFVYAARATATVTVSAASSIVGTSASICGLTTWAYQDSTDYFRTLQPTLSTTQSSYVTFDLGSSYAPNESSGLFLRLATCGGSVPYSRLRCQISADGLTYYERQMEWKTSGTTYSAKTAQWYTAPTGKQMTMIPTCFALTNRTTGTPLDLSVDANRTGVTRGLRKWDAISISSQNFSNDYAATEEWWYMFNGVRGCGTFSTTGSVDQNTIGYNLKVGGGLVYSHNVYSLNCTSLCMVTSWETGGYSHLWAVSASNDQVNWTEMATGAFSDTTKMKRWTANAGDGGVLYQGASGGTANMFYKLSWANTKYYVYWKFGIKTAGTPMSGSFCNCGVLYEIEWE
jgi:hypothetical protein